MDQESFRKLLQAPSAAATPKTRGSLLSAATKTKKADTTKLAFKPRTVKKKSDAYRDRAEERRLGLSNEYAQVEALAEDFERKAAEAEDRAAIEEQRRYLGGDSEHSVLVKGLDFALLEQNRARLAATTSVEDDDTLERAFEEVATVSRPDGAGAQGKKRTRAEILQELKRKRGDESAEPVPSEPKVDLALEEAKKAGKFRPIGFKPVGGDKKKRKDGSGEKGSERKKKRKVEKPSEAPAPSAPLASEPEAGPSKTEAPLPKPVEQEPEPLDEDFDIFADAGEYTGVDLGDDEESESESKPQAKPELEEGEEAGEDSGPPTRRWFADEESPSHPPPDVSPEARPSASASRSPPPVTVPQEPEEEEEEEGIVGGRLQPLASSALPSIRELLALDSAEDKKKGRKDRKRGKGGATATAGDGESGEKKTKDKVERDYKRLKAFTDKKAAAA